MDAAEFYGSDAYLGQVTISRLKSDSARMMVYATLRDSGGALLPDHVLQDGDSIRVFSVTEFRQGMQRIYGKEMMPVEASPQVALF